MGQSEIFIREKQYDSTSDSGLFTLSATLRKVLNAAEHSFRANAVSLLVSTALRFSLVKKMTHATNNYIVSVPHALLEGKRHLVNSPSLPHQRIKYFHCSSKSAQKGKSKIPTLCHL